MHDHGCAAPDPVKIARFQAEAAEHARIHKAERLSKARWLRSRRCPVFASIAQTYLAAPWIPRHDTRDPWPSTGIQRVSGRADRGIRPTETVPGGIAIADDAVMGVHITRLLPDGSWPGPRRRRQDHDRPLSRVADRAGVVQRSAWIDDR